MQDRPSVSAPIDFRRLFDAVAHPLLVLDLDLWVVVANSAYCAILGRSREVLVGREAFSPYVGNPRTPAANGVQALRTSMAVALDTGQTQVMPLQRGDVQDPTTDIASKRYWNIVNVRVLDDQGATVLLLNSIEYVTAWFRKDSIRIYIRRGRLC